MMLRILAHLSVIAGLIAPTLLYGATAIEKSSATAIEKSGATAIEKSGATAIEKSGATAIEKNGATAIEHRGATAIEKFAACDAALPVPQLSGLLGSARVAQARLTGRGIQSCRTQAGLRPERKLRPDFIVLGRPMDSEDETLSLTAVPAEPSAPAATTAGASAGGSPGSGLNSGSAAAR